MISNTIFDTIQLSNQKTTKLRVVYNAPAKTKKSKPSLKEIYTEDQSSGLLMIFRTKKNGIVVDIAKAFLQIGPQPKERNVTRFWAYIGINVG